VGRPDDLIAYREAVALADDLRAEVAGWPSFDQWTVGVQLVRSADSIGANIAEALGRGTPRDEQRFILFARASAQETQHWIERGHARKLLPDDSYRARVGRVGQLVNGLLRAARRDARETKDE
jgi:four helix bundle protein